MPQVLLDPTKAVARITIEWLQDDKPAITLEASAVVLEREKVSCDIIGVPAMRMQGDKTDIEHSAQCVTCRWYQPWERQDGGQCYALPPTVIWAHTSRSDVVPNVEEDHGCQYWKPQCREKQDGWSKTEVKRGDQATDIPPARTAPER